MLKIRLQRIGRRNDPAFRVVVTESTRGPKSNQYVELLGSYNPRQGVRAFKADRITHWISQGAQVSDTMHNLLVSENIISGNKINVLPKKSPIAKEAPEETAPQEVSADEASSEGAHEVAGSPEEESTEETASSEESSEEESKEETPEEPVEDPKKE